MKKIFLALATLLPLLALAQQTTVITSPNFLSDQRTTGVNTVKNAGTNGSVRNAAVYTAQEPTDHPSFVLSFNVSAVNATDIFSLPYQTNHVVRLRRIVLVNPGSATAATTVDLQLGVAQTSGSGGASCSSSTAPADNTANTSNGNRAGGVTGGPDPQAGSAGWTGSCRIGDTTQATSFLAIYNTLVTVSVPSTAGGFTPIVIYDARDPQFKPITTSGSVFINLRTPAIGAGATGLRGYAEFTVDDA